MSEVKKCPKCDAEMEEGFFVRIDSAKPIAWKKPGFSGLRTLRVFVYKCKTCGYLELYAEK